MQPAVENSLAAMEATGNGDKFLPMLADFVAAMNGLEETG